LKKIAILFILLITLSAFSSEVYLMDEELPPERFQMLGDNLYIYSVNLLQKLKTDFEWDNIKKTLNVQWNGNFIQFNNNSTKVTLNGEQVYLTTAPRIINNRFFLPLIDTCRLLGLRMVSLDNKYYIYSSVSELENYYWIPNGLVLSFSKPVSVSVAKQGNNSAIFEVIGARTGVMINTQNSMNGVNGFTGENISENTMKPFLRLSFRFDNDISFEPVTIGSTVYLIKTDTFVAVEDKAKENDVKRIVIDPGHGGFDPGAISPRGFQEKDGVLQISKFLAKKLQDKGYEVYLTRSRDNYIELMERGRFANQKNADLFISVHLNSLDNSTVEGVELYYYSFSEYSYKVRLERLYGASTLNGEQIQKKVYNKIDTTLKSEEYVQMMSDVFISQDFKMHKTVAEDFAVLAYPEMPAILIECGFLSNPSFAKQIQQAQFQEQIAETITKGVMKFFGDTEEEEEKETN
jgi:N-acetylmuramoyl-L-alanine amidase